MTYFIFIEVNSKNSSRTDGQGGPKPAIFEAKTAQFRQKCNKSMLCLKLDLNKISLEGISLLKIQKFLSWVEKSDLRSLTSIMSSA